MTGRRLLVALSAGMLTIGVASAAHAQSKAAPVQSKAAPASKGAEEPAAAAGPKKAAPRKVLRLEEMRVEGRVQKPQALFLMPRASVTSGEMDRPESFLSKAKDAVEKDPF